jgi:5'-3' exonuclease
MKQTEESVRQQRRDKKIAELESISSESLPDMYERVKKIRPSIAYRREDFAVRIANECNKLGISVIQAPFEAKRQLVEAQKAGLIDIIILDDGDVFVLGGDNIVSSLSYRTGECFVYKQSDVLAKQTMGGGEYKNELAALVCFLGCDFVKKLDGNGQ